MTKTYQLFSKSDVPSASNLVEQKQPRKRETGQMRLIQKMRRLSLHSLITKQEPKRTSIDNHEQNRSAEKANNSSMLSKATTTIRIPDPSMQRSSISETQVNVRLTDPDQSTLKGILKDSSKNLLLIENSRMTDDHHDQYVKVCGTASAMTSLEENNNSRASSGKDESRSCRLSNTSLLVKHVTFSEETLKKKCKPSQSVGSLPKLPSRH